MSRTLRGALFGAAASLLALSCVSSDTTSQSRPESLPDVGTPAAVARVARFTRPNLSAFVGAAAPRAAAIAPTAIAPTKAASIAAPSGSSPAQAALHHMARLTPALPGARAVAEVVDVQRLAGGASVVRVRQRVGGIEIYGGDVRMLIDADGTLSSMSGSVQPGVAPAAFATSAEDAVTSAIGSEFKISLRGAHFGVRGKSGDYQSLIAPPRTDVALDQVRTKQIYLPAAGGLVPAWFVEFFGNRGPDARAMRYLVSADGSKVLRRINLTASEAFKYTVFADATGDKRPLDGPIADFTPHPDSAPSGRYPGYIAPNRVTIDGFNKTKDPWLAAGASVASGNNVDPFTDRNGDDKADAPDLRATITGQGEFNYVYNPENAPDLEIQTKAGLVQLFYIINWLHDWYYDSGFDETAGNAQLDNYGRGGEQSDAIQANGQDGATSNPGTDPSPSRNNANMSTPADGASPRMQMFLWTNSQSTAVLPTGAVVGGSFTFGAPAFDVEGDVVLINDGSTAATMGTGTVTDGCQPISANLTNKIALIDRGSCNFTDKVANAQTAHAAGVLIANNDPVGGPAGGTGSAPEVVIGVVGISQAAGTDLKDRLTRGTVHASMKRVVGTELDGDLDTQVIAHEWGHYLHHRLSSCESTQQCGALSEGWADFISLHLVVRPTDNFEGTYGLGIFDTHRNSPDAAYYAIRRFPYSVDKTKNPLTFKHISDKEPMPTTAPISPSGGDNSEVHNAGEIWAETMWEAYHDLLKAHTYDDARRRMSNYVVAGLKLVPGEATFTESRDALLAAAAKSDPEDMKKMAAAFARRGMGSCAESPPPGSQDLSEVVESFDVKANLQTDELDFSDEDPMAVSCDHDGHLDPGETGILRFKLKNVGPLDTTNVQVVATTATAGVTVTPLAIARMAAFSEQGVVLKVVASGDAALEGSLELAIKLTGTTTCGDVTETVKAHLGVDEQASISTTDDVEALHSAWVPEGELANVVWFTGPDENGNRIIHGENPEITTDTQLVTPTLKVGKSHAFVVKFDQRYAFETGPVVPNGPDMYFDGGVIEVSKDNGKTWEDVTKYAAKPGYTQKLITGDGADYVSENPLAGQDAFGGISATFPELETVTLDFGKKLQGRQVKLRFRIGSDQGSKLYGWDLDNFTFSGIENKPFTALIPEHGVCNAGVGVDAGPDLEVGTGDSVSLEGISTLPNVAWTQVSGPKVTLTGADQATATFKAPDDDGATMVFRLTGTDGTTTLTDEATIVIGEDDGCGCASSRTPGAGLLIPLAAVGFALRRRRR